MVSFHHSFPSLSFVWFYIVLCFEYHYIWAIGRSPRTDLGLDKVGVEMTKEGYIKVDEFQNTSYVSFLSLLCFVIPQSHSTKSHDHSDLPLSLLHTFYLLTEQNRTPGIYAVGDVTGHVQLTPVAIAAGKFLFFFLPFLSFFLSFFCFVH